MDFFAKGRQRTRTYREFVPRAFARRLDVGESWRYGSGLGMVGAGDGRARLTYRGASVEVAWIVDRCGALWLCPVCGSRRRWLYWWQGGPRCMACAGLHYWTDSQTDARAAWTEQERHAQKMRKAGLVWDEAEYMWIRPAGMRRTYYRKLVDHWYQLTTRKHYRELVAARPWTQYQLKRCERMGASIERWAAVEERLLLAG